MTREGLKQEAAGILQRAAAYIRRYGWQEEGMGDYGAPRCSMGAIDSACPRGRWNDQVAELLYESLYCELDGLSLTQYNHKFQDGEKIAQLYERVATALTHG